MNASTNGAEKMLFAVHFRLSSLTDLLHREVNPVLDAAPRSTALDGAVLGLVQRALAWGLTFRKLGDVFDFQAHSAGCRSLFEIAVDLVLLAGKLEPVEKLVAWEDHCRLRASREIAIDPTGPFAGHAAQALALLKLDEAKAAASLKLHWPNLKKAPPRWTGRGVPDDAHRADAHRPSGFATFATKNYARLNWGTHGSGLILPKALGPHQFPGVAIVAVGESFGLLATVIRIALEHFGIDVVPWEARIHQAWCSGPVEATRRELDEIVRIAEGPGTADTGARS